MFNSFSWKIIGLSLLSMLVFSTASFDNSTPNQAASFFEMTANYQVQDEEIIFDFGITNHHDLEQVLQMGSGQQYEIIITNEAGEQVYRYSEGKAFTLALVYQTLKPGEVLNWQEKWNLTNKDGEKLEPGKYFAEIRILANLAASEIRIPEEQLTANLEINLAAQHPQSIIQQTSDEVIAAIKYKDAQKISEFVHPVKGVRFTPYTYVSLEQDLVFDQEAIKNFFTDQNKYHWGYYDGTGFDILLTPAEYYDKFIYTHDFINAEQIGYNEVLSFGNMLENQFEVYENPIVVEYYFSGFNPDYAGMDWCSLRLVFEQYQATWKLVGVIYNQWTV